MTDDRDEREDPAFNRLLESPRFYYERSWWLIAEVVARVPNYVVVERGAPYSSELRAVSSDGSNSQPFFSTHRGGSNYVGDDSRRTELGMAYETFFVRRPLELVEATVSAMRVTSSRVLPPISARAIAYQFIGAILAARLNHLDDWDCVSVIGEGDGEIFDTGYLNRFPNAAEDARLVPIEGWEPASDARRHFWAITRAKEPMAIVSDFGMLYLSNEPDLLGRARDPLDLADTFRRRYKRDIQRMAVDLAQAIDVDQGGDQAHG